MIILRHPEEDACLTKDLKTAIIDPSVALLPQDDAGVTFPLISCVFPAFVPSTEKPFVIPTDQREWRDPLQLIEILRLQALKRLSLRMT